VQSFTARMPLLMAASASGLGRRRWSCCLDCVHANNAAERKRDAYDRCGMDVGVASGFTGDGHAAHSSWHHQMPSFHRAHYRDPFEVFREFFGGQDPFGKCNCT